MMVATDNTMSEVESDTKEEKGEVLDLNKVGLNLICESVGIVILCQTLLQDILRRTAQLEQMQEVLPRKSGRYLRGIIGNVDCSILDKNEKYQYKEQYEQFKLIVNLIGKTVVSEGWLMMMYVQEVSWPPPTTSSTTG